MMKRMCLMVVAALAAQGVCGKRPQRTESLPIAGIP